MNACTLSCEPRGRSYSWIVCWTISLHSQGCLASSYSPIDVTGWASLLIVVCTSSAQGRCLPDCWALVLNYIRRMSAEPPLYVTCVIFPFVVILHVLSVADRMNGSATYPSTERRSRTDSDGSDDQVGIVLDTVGNNWLSCVVLCMASLTLHDVGCSSWTCWRSFRMTGWMTSGADCQRR